MPISRSVRRTAQNDLTDVLLVQILLNMNTHRFPDPQPRRSNPMAASGQAPSVPSSDSRRR